ncbi:unnamed protein product (macronuclear) [Paramecium tetraurelia]|uniref:EF-hand domain-containing protein n=1 Tax=Paramecium tetraurelia TaxID=5888 RepID=A0C4R5_PARTE|nr:uncharacterized protein GSPATT00006281001 [Paramecium tetraurelia]CAK65782.1 unnamed protein product [Paramecium tetraurelia]|eukprot:XP_001433179.1 hypothetical protein (macronuclear) [Paramecium tetraurelia strain d4-2]
MDMLQTLQLWKQIKTTLQSKFSDLKSTFDSIDSNKNGTIELNELSQELNNNHGITQKDQIQSIFSYLNISKSGQITLEEFEKQWTSAEQQIQQEQNRQQFQKQKQQVQSYIQTNQQLKSSVIQKSILQKSGSSQQFSDLFNSYKSNNSPTKYINIQGDFSINQFNTPPLLDRRNSPLKVLSPPKPEQYPKTRQEAKDDKLREMQRQISYLFNCKNEQKNSSPRLKQNLDTFMNTMKLGGGGGRRSSGHTFRYENKTQTISPKLSDQISLQNYAYQFNDMKMQFKQTYTGNKSNNSLKGNTFFRK